MEETLTIRLGSDLAQALQEQARQTGRSRGEIAREALQSHLQRSGTPGVMRRYFGAVRGPTDLSTNKAYRRAWNRKRP